MVVGGGDRSRLGWSAAAALACMALVMLGAPAVSAAADEAAWMYDPNAVVEIDLGGLSEAEIDALEAEPDEYQPGTFELKVDGVPQGPALGEVGIRLKGGTGSFRPLTEKAGFKIKFNEFVAKQVFFGLEKMTLNNMVQDPSMLHEALSYELFDAMGLPGPRAGYARVQLNDHFYGVYLNLETLDKIWLPQWFATTQHLYEADTPKVDVYPGGAPDFEVDRGNVDDLSDLEELIAAANSNTGDWSEGMAAVADLEQMTREWAVERYVGHWDGYAGSTFPGAFRPNNYYLHSDASGLFTMLPWGTDQTWEVRLEFDEEAGGILFNRCTADESCRALYVEALEDLFARVSSGCLELPNRAVERAELLAPGQELEEADRREYSSEEIAAGVEEVREFIADRPGELADWLQVFYTPPVEVPPGSPGSACRPPEPPAPTPGPPAAAPSTPPIPPALRIGRSRAVGSFVSTLLELPGAGTASQRVTAKIGGSRKLACLQQRTVATARALTIGCRLSTWARDQLETSPLALRIRVGFEPSAGTPQFDVRRLVLR